jgi:taurine---2-oxoglutarate transaminase
VMGRVKSELIAHNVLPFLADNRIHVVPPCIVTPDEVAEAVAAYDEVLGLPDLLS